MSRGLSKISSPRRTPPSAVPPSRLPPAASVRPRQLANSTMSRKLASPAAQLLRNSRLFSLPPPIPEARNSQSTMNDFTSGSDTATQPFPTRQAIATPASSLHRGDWGLKRPLPLRETTRSTAPTMRVYEVDTINLFTDFESAGDHVRTLEKWQEMNIPLNLRPKRMTASSNSSPTSVFTDSVDNTQLTPEMERQGYSKWKHDGPWISGMSEAQFNTFLKSRVRTNKEDFMKYLRKHFIRNAQKDAKIAARDIAGDDESGGDDTPAMHFEMTDRQFEDKLKLMREDTVLSSELSRLIRDYFDLPAIYDEAQSLDMSGFVGKLLDSSQSGETGPPTTHPSAGLSYLRSAAFLQNHPILGPREEPEPIEARMLATRQMKTAANVYPKAGVGGVVADYKFVNNAYRTADAASTMKYDQPGGTKVWVTAEHAHIDENGRIRLAVKPAVEQDVQIKRGSLKSKEELEVKPVSRVAELETRASNFDSDGEPKADQRIEIWEMLKNQEQKAR